MDAESVVLAPKFYVEKAEALATDAGNRHVAVKTRRRVRSGVAEGIEQHIKAKR